MTTTYFTGPDAQLHREITDAAMCMWEYALEKDTDIARYVASWRDTSGTAWLRSAIMDLAPAANNAYQIAVQRGLDWCFDWEFIPWFMRNCLVWDSCLALAPSWEVELLLMLNHQRD